MTHACACFHSQRCYPEYYQLAVLAQELGAKGVLFGMDSDTERPEFPGPGQIPALFQIPAFRFVAQKKLLSAFLCKGKHLKLPSSIDKNYHILFGSNLFIFNSSIAKRFLC